MPFEKGKKIPVFLFSGDPSNANNKFEKIFYKSEPDQLIQYIKDYIKNN